MDLSLADKLMYIPNDVTQNYPFCRLRLVVETFEHSTKWINQLKFNKVPKIVKPMNTKRYYQTLGTSVINSPMSPTFSESNQRQQKYPII